MKIMREFLAFWLLKWYTVCIRTWLGIYGQIYTFAFSSFLGLLPRELLHAKGYIWLYIPPLVLIRIQYCTVHWFTVQYCTLHWCTEHYYTIHWYTVHYVQTLYITVGTSWIISETYFFVLILSVKLIICFKVTLFTQNYIFVLHTIMYLWKWVFSYLFLPVVRFFEYF